MMMLFTTILLGTVCYAWESSPVVKSSSGTYLGSILTARNGQIYNAYRGIPYAEPPIGDLRFRSPVSASPIDGLYDASDFKPYCIQLNIMPSEFGLGQEDCLYLNVFTTRRADRDGGDLKKVFVFFHGGGNANGFPNTYLPGTLVTEHNVIVVTVAYRLGYLGLLSTMTPSCEGNFHLKDQLQSLVWVKENILNFGGDPSEVTIGGGSAGAFDTSLLTLVPSSRDLFARAYCQSGTTGTRNSVLITNPRPQAIKLGRQMSCLGHGQADPVTEPEFDDMVNCLRQVPALRFSQNGTQDIPNLQPVLYGDLFHKNIEELFSDEDYLKSIKFFHRDYLLGLNQNEGGIFTVMNDQMLSTYPEVRKFLTPQIMFYNAINMFLTPVFGQVSQEVALKIIEYYENNYEFSPITDFCADAVFQIRTLQYATAAAVGHSSEDSRVYLFQLVHSPQWLLAPYKGMIHGLDLLYLFDLDIKTMIKLLPVKVDSTRWNRKDELLKKKFTTMVADFIKTGNAGRSLTSDLPSGWPGFDEEQQQYLELGLKSQVKHHLLSERVELWSEQIPKWIRHFPLAKEKSDEL